MVAKVAKDKAKAEYQLFNKTQKINSDFEKTLNTDLFTINKPIIAPYPPYFLLWYYLPPDSLKLNTGQSVKP